MIRCSEMIFAPLAAAFLTSSSALAIFSSLSGVHFICVAAYDGASFDVVGIGVNNKDPLDSTPPSLVQTLVNTDYDSSTFLEWMLVPDSDIAGYQVYYSAGSFVEPTQWTPKVNYLVGDNKFPWNPLLG